MKNDQPRLFLLVLISYILHYNSKPSHFYITLGSTLSHTARTHTEFISSQSPDTGNQLSALTHTGVADLEGSGLRMRRGATWLQFALLSLSCQYQENPFNPHHFVREQYNVLKREVTLTNVAGV